MKKTAPAQAMFYRIESLCKAIKKLPQPNFSALETRR